MDSYWKSKVLPKLKKVFENKNGVKKAAAAEATKAFDESKVEFDKEFEEKKTELQPKVVEIYEAAPPKIKALVKEPKEAGVKKNSAAVTKFLEELEKIDFPGAKKVSEIAKSIGPALVPGPVIYILEKVSTLLPVEEAPAAAAAAEPEEKAAVEEGSGSKDREVVVAAEEEKKEEETSAAAAPPAEEIAASEAAVAEASTAEEAAEPAKPAEEAPKA